MLWLISVLTLGSLSCLLGQQLSDFYGVVHRDHAQHLIQKVQANGLLVAEDYFSALRLQNLTSANIFSCNCDFLAKRHFSSEDIKEAFYGEEINRLCNCGLKIVDFKARDLEIIVENADRLDVLAGAVRIASSMQIEISENVKLIALEKLKGLMVGSSGLFKGSYFGEVSIQNTYTAVELLISLSEVKEASDFIVQLFDKFLSLISEGDEAEIDPTLIVILTKASDKKLRLLPPRLSFTAENLLSLALLSDINTVVRAVEGLQIVSSYKASPLYVDFVRTSFVSQRQADSTYELVLTVKNVFGLDEKLVDVELVSLKSLEEVLSVQELTFENGLLRIPSQRVTTGSYLVECSLNIEGRPKKYIVSTKFFITEDAVLSNVFIGVADDANYLPEMVKISQIEPNTAVFAASALLSQLFLVEFSVTSHDFGKVKKPHQCFLSLTNSETGKVTSFVARRKESDTYEVRISLKADSEKFLYSSGLYSVAVFVGDSSFSSPIKLNCGMIDIKFPTVQTLNLPLYAKSLLHTSDTTLKLLPEIFHVMRPDAKQASTTMSSIFSVLTLVPLVWFLGFVASLKLNLRRLTSVSSFTLVVGFTVILTLYIGYWLALEGVSFYQTIKYLSCIFPVFIVIGRSSLSVVSSIRISSSDNDKSK